MKKSLFTLFCVAMLGTSAAMAAPMSLQKGKTVSVLRLADSPQCFTNEKAAVNALSRKAPAKADSAPWMNWGYCGSPYNAFQMNYEGTMKQAIMVTEDIATKFAGAEITAVQFANPTNQLYENPLAGEEVTVWVSESLDGEPICSGTGVFGPNGFEYSSINLDTPYTLVEGTPVYIGFTFFNPNPSGYRNGLFTLVTDYSYPENDCSAFLYSTYEGIDNQGYMVFGDEYSWKSIGTEVGNFCITATLCGDMLPQNDMVFSDYLLPAVVKPNTDFNFVFISQNVGANEVSNMDVTFSMEGVEPQVKRVELNYGPLSYNAFSQDTVVFSCSKTGNNLPYEIQITAVNGTPVEDGSKINGSLLCIENGFDRNVVIEEATGTWCGWCVVGYAGMEYMRENYAGKGFIGIAMHQGDRMSVLDKGEAYESFYGYIAGFPSAFMDRNWAYDIYPSPDELEYEFLNMVANPAFAKIEGVVVAEEGSKDITLVTRTQFAEGEENADYGVAYTVVEDGLGPYDQANYPSGSGADYFGFENEPNPVKLVFNDVAKNCSKPLPIDNSLPSATEANTEYEFSTDITLTGVRKLDAYRIVAMVIDRKTGFIMNACEIIPQSYTSVDAISTGNPDFRVMGGKGFLTISNEVSANVYSTDGRMMAKGINGNVQLPAGIYIVRAGNKSAKVIVR